MDRPVTITGKFFYTIKTTADVVKIDFAVTTPP